MSENVPKKGGGGSVEGAPRTMLLFFFNSPYVTIFAHREIEHRAYSQNGRQRTLAAMKPRAWSTPHVSWGPFATYETYAAAVLRHNHREKKNTINIQSLAAPPPKGAHGPETSQAAVCAHTQRRSKCLSPLFFTLSAWIKHVLSQQHWLKTLKRRNA